MNRWESDWVEHILDSLFNTPAGVLPLLDVIKLAGSVKRPGETSFPHHDLQYNIEFFFGTFIHGLRRFMFCAAYPSTDQHAVVVDYCESMNRFWQSKSALAGKYANYREQEATLQQYYRHNLPRLQHIKALYDSDYFFRFEQSIPPRFQSVGTKCYEC